MIYLKKINDIDLEEEYKLLKNIPKEENGVKNDFSNISFEFFRDKVVKCLINNSIGLNLVENEVPNTIYFLWDNNTIVGLYKIRHTLSNLDDNGHIGYYIDPNFRNMGYGTNGLKLAIEEAKNLIKEYYIYMNALKTNEYSLKIQLSVGAIIYKEDNLKYYTKVKIR